MNDIDYRQLLTKYIDHVGRCEGVTCIGRGWLQESDFTEAEQSELERLEREVDEANARLATPFPGPLPCHECGEPAQFSVMTSYDPVTLAGTGFIYSCFQHRAS